MIKNMLDLILVTFAITLPISLLWVFGIDDMNKKHPDYEGDDFLDKKF